MNQELGKIQNLILASLCILKSFKKMKYSCKGAVTFQRKGLCILENGKVPCFQSKLFFDIPKGKNAEKAFFRRKSRKVAATPFQIVAPNFKTLAPNSKSLAPNFKTLAPKSQSLRQISNRCAK
jgi:hypothetical protein